MKYVILSFLVLVGAQVGAQKRFDVSSSSEFSQAQAEAIYGDSIVWLSGTYTDIRMDIDTDGITVTAEPYGTVLFTGVSRAVINGDDVTFSGFQYIGGFIGTLDVMRIYGSDALITHVNIQNYTSHKYLVVYEESRRTTISYCNFENRFNLDDKNILSILVDDEPGYHKIQYCSFKNFDGIGQDQGIEPIRIGVSSQGHLDSRTLVEYCYFTRCNGDGEIISHKSRQNVYRYNTFENNPVAELVLRHGDEGIVYGNFFLNNMGGIRVREGSDHFIYNNYFEGLERRAIFLQNDPSDPLSNIHIYHNTIINSEEIILGGSGDSPPSNVTIANNVFANPRSQLFVEETGNESWLSNYAFGDLGIDNPGTGIADADPMLFENIEGFFQPAATSPVIASAGSDYPEVPLYPGMTYDNGILLDVMKEPRPLAIGDRAVGASEFSSSTPVLPHANELNTGPSYLFDNLVDYLTVNASQLYIGKDGDVKSIMISSNMEWTVENSDAWISTDLTSGSSVSQLIIAIAANGQSSNRSGTVTIANEEQSVTILIYQDAGDPVAVVENSTGATLLYPNPTDGRIQLSNLPNEARRALVEIINLDGTVVISTESPVDDGELMLNLGQLIPGSYVVSIKFMSHFGTVGSEISRTFIKY